MTEKKWIEIQVDKKNTKTKQMRHMSPSYTSWQHAWTLLMQNYQNAKITVLTRQDHDGNILEFHGNESIGYCVFVRLQIEEIGFDFTERLAILDNANNPQIIADYEFVNAKKQTVKVCGLGMDDICNTIQRCTVKAIARAGIGLNVYQGDYSDIKDEYHSKAESANRKITEAELTELQQLIAIAGKNAENLCIYYNIQSLEELTYKQYLSAKRTCEKAINSMNSTSCEEAINSMN